MADASVRGADDFFRLSKALKRAGRGDLRKELNKAMKDAAKPLIEKTRAEARSSLPSRGGLAEQVAKEPARVQVRTGAQTAGVRIVVGKRRGGARSTDTGTIRHPVFGTGRWVTQRVDGGWFSDTLRDSAPAVRPSLERVLQDMAQKVVNDVKRGG